MSSPPGWAAIVGARPHMGNGGVPRSLRRASSARAPQSRPVPSPALATRTQPWLAGLLACGLAAEAAAVRSQLSARGLAIRSVPAGEALAAWTCSTAGSTLAVVVSGRGPGAARRTAGFWAPRAAAVVVTGAASPTGMLDRATVLVLDGDDAAAAAARSHAAQPGVEVAAGRGATGSAVTLV